MKKYPNLKKVDGRFGLLKNKGWFLSFGPFDSWNLMSSCQVNLIPNLLWSYRFEFNLQYHESNSPF